MVGLALVLFGDPIAVDRFWFVLYMCCGRIVAIEVYHSNTREISREVEVICFYRIYYVPVMLW